MVLAPIRRRWALSFLKGHFDQVEIGLYGRGAEESGTGFLERFLRSFAFVAARLVLSKYYDLVIYGNSQSSIARKFKIRSARMR